MDRLSYDENKIEEYVIILTKKIKEFIDVVHNIDNQKQKVIWESDNYNELINQYDEMIKDYLAYSDRMIKLIDFLNGSLNRFDESLNMIKKEYNKLQDNYNLEVEYE